MTPEQIARDEAEHRKILERSRAGSRKMGCCEPIMTLRQARRLDAANRRALRAEDDVETEAPDHRTFDMRLHAGFEMLRAA